MLRFGLSATLDRHFAVLEEILRRLTVLQEAAERRHEESIARLDEQGRRTDEQGRRTDELLEAYLLQLRQTDARYDRAMRETVKQLQITNARLDEVMADGRASREALLKILDRMDDAA